MRISFIKSAVFAVALAAFGLVASSANAQNFTVLYDYTGNLGNEASEAVVSQPTGASFSTIARGAGLGTNLGGNSLNSNNFTQASAIDLNDFYGFTVTPNVGNQVSLTTLSYRFQRSGTGPTQFAIRSNVDGFASDLFTTSENSTTTGLTRTFNLSGVPGLQNRTAATTLRIYGFASGGANGTFRLSSPSAGTGTSIAGTVAAVGPVNVPEAGTFALIAPVLGVLGVVVARRRKLA